MYIPPYYKEEDESKLLKFMNTYNFATLISTQNGIPIATHLPFLIEKRGEKLFLVSHMAKANPQWQTFSNSKLLVIFQGPHAYVSPSHYEKQKNVPTWNYIAVHAYGDAKIIDTDDNLIRLMENTIQQFEKEFYSQWKSLPPNYVDGMLKAIVGFEIEVDKLEGKFKLSQNKTKDEQQNIINTFEKSIDSIQKEIANEMKKKI